MVISHKYRYIFVENPLTASWAIRQELCQFYSGEPVLHKHATIPEFFRTASREEKQYFLFITVRNPLDVLVSRYLKYKNDHRRAFSSAGSIEENLIDYSDRKKYEYVQRNPNFEDFFLEHYHRPYSDLVDVASKELDGIIRYEHLQEDFVRILDKLGIQPVRPIPQVNKTSGKTVEWTSYYTSEELIQRAKEVCGPFMQKWGYDFPPEWGGYILSPRKKMEFAITVAFKNTYINYFRNNQAGYAQYVRRLRAFLLR